MTAFTLTVLMGGETAVLTVDGEKTLFQILREAHLPVPESPCGGRGRCGKCTVKAQGALRSLSDGAVKTVNGPVRSCQYFPAGDVTVWLKAAAAAPEVPAVASAIPGGGTGQGLAIDLGTTTVTAALYDLATGALLRVQSELNAQRAYGADVITRIQHCREGHFQDLFDATCAQLATLSRDTDRLTRVAIAGNTVMEHLAAGLDPSPLAVPPFTVRSLFGQVTDSPLWPGARVYYSRCVSAYVGGDITAGMAACGLQHARGLVLYVDIGTNGEIALGNRDGYTVCATAAGPAFEGAEISCGMPALPGAIDTITVEHGDIRIHVIGGGKATGICGSGLINAVVALLDLHLLGRSGRLIPRDSAPEHLRHRFVEVDGVRAFAFAEGVSLTVHDIHAILLAKAAIRAGMETMLQGRQPTEVLVAGGFGSYINVKNAVRIGLLPPLPETSIRQVGNAAARGAALLLTDGFRQTLDALTEKCTYVDLSSSPDFNRTYIDQLTFTL